MIYTKAEEIEDTPTFGKHPNGDFILGMAKMACGENFFPDTTQVQSSEDIASVEGARRGEYEIFCKTVKR